MLKSTVVLGSAVFSAVLAGLGVLSLDPHFMTRQATVEAAPASSATEEAFSAPASPYSGNDSHITAIPKANDGHFWANAMVNDKAVRFLVDTGATVVVLTPADAQRLGYTAANLTYDQKVTTANGQTFAALVTLTSVGVGQSKVQSVDALVVKDGLSTSLLGMSYLGRLSRFEATPSSLILHP